MKQEIRLLSCMLAGSLTLVSSLALAEEDRSEVLERIKPVGTLSITGQPAAKKAEPAPAAASAAPAKETAQTAAPAQTAAADGESIYKKTCFACHATGAAGAPKLDDKANWAPRIAKGMDALYASSVNGTAKGMPPKGTCMTCSDAELKATVDYMVSQAK